MRALRALPTGCRHIASLVCFVGLAWAPLLVCASFASADEPTLTLRIAWGGGAERTWRGTIAISSGKLGSPQPLGLEPDEAGTIWINEAGAVEIRGASSRTYDGVDVEVRADLSAKLLIALAADGEPIPIPISVDLAKLVKESHVVELDDKKNRLLVRRAPGDALRVRIVQAGEVDRGQSSGAAPRLPQAPARVQDLAPDSEAMTMPHLVFDPGERFVIRVQPHLLGIEPSASVGLRAQLQFSQEKRELWSRDQELKFPPVGEPDPILPLEIQAPAEPGVYDLVLTVSRTAAGDRMVPIAGSRVTDAVVGLPGLSRLRGEVLVQRHVQFIVVSDTAVPAAKRPAPPTTELMTINPGKTWWDRVAHVPRIAGLGKDPLEFGAIERWEHPKLGPLVVLRGKEEGNRGQGSGVRGKETGVRGQGSGVGRAEERRAGGVSPLLARDQPSDETWVAYPLAVSQPGQVHVVEVEYPSDMPQAMGISIVEPNAAGSVVPIGLDSGVYVPGLAGSAGVAALASSEGSSLKAGLQQGLMAGTQPAHMATHRVTFWPRTRAPLLVISRVGGAAQAAHGRIRLYGPKRYGVGALRLGIDAHSALAPALPNPGGSERMVMGMLERPLFPENFGAAEAFDAWSGGSLDDWTTFYEGGRRMIEYAQHVGYNALVVSVLADGSTIYPSERLAPTPRYDTGAFFSTGQDPVRKDVLEMLLRLADREQMTLIPLLQFSAPLPELEEISRRGGPEAVGLQLVGASGATWMEKHGSRRGQTAYYNPLDPLVQQAMRNVVRELAGRYRQHRSFGGAALGSSGPCFTLLPGIEWGLDDATIDRFCREKQVSIPAEGPGRFAQRAKAVSGPHRQAWLAWRAEIMHRFHKQLSDDLTAARPGAKLLVATGGMLQGPDAEAALRPTLPPRLKLEELPLAAGIRCDLYGRDEGIVLLRPRLVSTPATPRTLAVDLPSGDAPDLDNTFAAAAGTGNLLLHTPVRARMASFDARSPFGADKTYLSMVTHLAPAEQESRRRFVQAIGGLDSPLLIDGGWMLTLGEEAALRPLFLTYRRLPLGEYQAVTGETQGITCRWLTRDGATYLTLLNPTPWPCRASLSVRGAEKIAVSELSGLREVPKIVGGQLSLAIEPYDLLAIKFGEEAPSTPLPSREGPGEGSSSITFSNLTVAFEQSIRDGLSQRIRELVTRAALLSEPRRVDVLANADFELPTDGRRELPGWTLAGGSGSQAVRDGEIKHGGTASARLSSRSGVASLISDPFEPPRTGRISIAVRLRTLEKGAAPTVRLALGGKLDGGDYYRFAEAPLDAQWRYFIFTVDNLPLSGLSELQVRFDLMGAGQAWVDDIVVSDLALSDHERTELSRIVTRAHYSLEDGRLADCVRLLDGYWPRFLEENVPLPPVNVAAKERTARTNPPLQDAESPKTPPAEAVPWWKRGLPSVLR